MLTSAHFPEVRYYLTCCFHSRCYHSNSWFWLPLCINPAVFYGSAPMHSSALCTVRFCSVYTQAYCNPLYFNFTFFYSL